MGAPAETIHVWAFADPAAVRAPVGKAAASAAPNRETAAATAAPTNARPNSLRIPNLLTRAISVPH